MSVKRVPPTISQHKKTQVNKKAIIWVSSIFSVLVILFALLLIFS
ncbi:hypothetical protein ABE099_04550 [Paenibacillus turicensis]|uniref:Membrane protein YvbJ n=1 Tax=Paenibacillus turicensis TaxID=160487 RepID=A0ABS4FTK7_9BACL|nr:hypothetical protein [Paenibacillus turicensis]MBP1905906.1 putative membrane protein YvbJ [Paenibacillus turicensis]